jgi:hypothetical protein
VHPLIVQVLATSDNEVVSVVAVLGSYHADRSDVVVQAQGPRVINRVRPIVCLVTSSHRYTCDLATASHLGHALNLYRVYKTATPADDIVFKTKIFFDILFRVRVEVFVRLEISYKRHPIALFKSLWVELDVMKRRLRVLIIIAISEITRGVWDSKRARQLFDR